MGGGDADGFLVEVEIESGDHHKGARQTFAPGDLAFGKIDWSDKESVRRSYWFTGYQARVRAQVHAYAQVAACERLVLVCIEGGAITQLEESVMHELMAEAVRDLHGAGHKGSPMDVAVEKETVTFAQFKARFPVAMDADAPAT